MPIVFSKPGASASPDQVPWIDKFVFLAESGQATTILKSLGFKAYIPQESPLLQLSPIEYLKLFRNIRIRLLQDHVTRASKPPAAQRTTLESPVMAPALQVTAPKNARARPVLATRRSSSMHKNVIAKLRPLPFQYIWTVWHDKAAFSSPGDSDSNTYANRLQVLASQVSDIGAFYRVYNNFPWDAIKLKNSVHIFRAGVEPLWEDRENLEGGCWIIKVRKEEGGAIKVWEEICLMGCGGELQAAISPERDHVLGLSYSPRLYWAHISVWTKQGSNRRSIEALQNTILERLSAELRPKSSGDYYYKRHSEHEGWEQAVSVARKSRDGNQGGGELRAT